MAKLTPEERKARVERNRAERQIRLNRFPAAWLNGDDYLSLRLPEGDGEWIGVKTELSEETYWLPILDPIPLARFISALIARYNALVERQNWIASELRMKPAEPIREA